MKSYVPWVIKVVAYLLIQSFERLSTYLYRLQLTCLSIFFQRLSTYLDRLQLTRLHFIFTLTSRQVEYVFEKVIFLYLDFACINLFIRSYVLKQTVLDKEPIIVKRKICSKIKRFYKKKYKNFVYNLCTKLSIVCPSLGYTLTNTYVKREPCKKELHTEN